MPRTNYKELLDAGVHFGHLKRKWNPNMSPYIFMERNGIHIIDLNKSAEKIEEAASALKQIAKTGRKILFVATKKQAKEIIANHIKDIRMPYATERWPGGMLTNFHTIRKAVKKMAAIDKMSSDGTFDNISKKEKLQIRRQREKLQKNLGSIADLTRLPAALFVVDIMKEHIAVAEARKLNIPTFAMVDTNSDPTLVDFPIPANDDSSKSISLIMSIMTKAILEGLEEREEEKEKEAAIAGKKESKTKKGQDKKAKEDEKKSSPAFRSIHPGKLRPRRKTSAKVDTDREEKEKATPSNIAIKKDKSPLQQQKTEEKASLEKIHLREIKTDQVSK